MQLSAHFTLEEFSQSQTAIRLGIDNTPPPEVIEHMKLTAQGMEAVRSLLGYPISPDSVFRCEALEHVLCRKDYYEWSLKHGYVLSQWSWTQYFARKAHPKGWAVDFTCAAYGKPQAIVRAIAGSGIKFDQLINEGAGSGFGWVHISFDPQLRGDVLTAVFTNGAARYTQGSDTTHASAY